MWFEKYKPTSLSECILSHLEPDVQKALYAIVNGTMPQNLLISGPPGSGKSMLANLIANEETFAVDRLSVLELDEDFEDEFAPKIRGASVLWRYRCVVCENLDYATMYGQYALRQMIDMYQASVFWIVTCNAVHEVDPAIQSRFYKINCGQVTGPKRGLFINSLVAHCRRILDAEGITAPHNELRDIVESCYPDVRRTINTLQIRYAHYASLKAA